MCDATLWTSPPPDDAKSEGFSGGIPLNLVVNGILVVTGVSQDMGTINSLKANPGGFGKNYHLLPPISVAAGFFVFRENLGVFYSYWWETIHF